MNNSKEQTNKQKAGFFFSFLSANSVFLRTKKICYDQTSER